MTTSGDYARFEKAAGGSRPQFETPRVHSTNGFYTWLIAQTKHQLAEIRNAACDLAIDDEAKLYAANDKEFREFLHRRTDLVTANLCHRTYIQTLPVAESEPVETEIAATIEVLPYPLEVWDETLYGEFAAKMTDGNFIPPEFFVESVKTCVGAIAGDRVRGKFKGGSLRQYTVLIGIPGKGKGEADRGARAIFRDLTEDVRDLASGDYITAAAAPVYKHIGAMLANPASDVGLIETATLCPRLIHNPTEFSEFLSKMHIDGSALPSIVRELFDSVWITPSTTSKRKAKDLTAMCLYSLLSTTQPETFEMAISQHGGLGSGLASRLTLISNKETRTVATLLEPNLGDWQKRMFAKLAALEQYPVGLNLSTIAKNLLDVWWMKLNDGQHEDESDEILARLNVIVLRNAMHLAWLRDSLEIEEGDMKKAIKLGDYQVAQRRTLVLPATDNTFASHQVKIKLYIERHGPSSARRIYKGVNAWRVGTKMHKEALDGLCGGDSPLLVKKPGQHKNQIVFHIVKHRGDE
jgi:hypothetical protein